MSVSSLCMESLSIWTSLFCLLIRLLIYRICSLFVAEFYQKMVGFFRCSRVASKYIIFFHNYTNGLLHEFITYVRYVMSENFKEIRILVTCPFVGSFRI